MVDLSIIYLSYKIALGLVYHAVSNAQVLGVDGKAHHLHSFMEKIVTEECGFDASA
jgi:hypothetical protein